MARGAGCFRESRELGVVPTPTVGPALAHMTYLSDEAGVFPDEAPPVMWIIHNRLHRAVSARYSRYLRSPDTA
jgi:hypothetical protein